MALPSLWPYDAILCPICVQVSPELGNPVAVSEISLTGTSLEISMLGSWIYTPDIFIMKCFHIPDWF